MLDFLCIGAQKAGTSWLHAQLERHPQVAFPHGKEVHYWDWVAEGKRPDDPQWYRTKFTSQPGKRLGDMTPAYSTLDASWVAKIAAEYPNCKVFIILRNPVDRAWSAARMVYECAQLQRNEVDEVWFTALFDSRASRRRGDYVSTIRMWAQHYEKSQLALFFYDDLRRDPRQFLLAIGRYLNLDSQPLNALPLARLQRRVRQGCDLELSPDLRAHLNAIYESEILALSETTGRDLSPWLRGEALGISASDWSVAS